jgi:hypothetical protein
MGHSRLAHDLRDAHPVDSILAEARCSPADDLVVMLTLVGTRMTHALPSVDP